MSSQRQPSQQQPRRGKNRAVSPEKPSASQLQLCGASGLILVSHSKRALAFERVPRRPRAARGLDGGTVRIGAVEARKAAAALARL